jgi:3-oxoacyl-[acyl-carrier protein] reductase
MGGFETSMSYTATKGGIISLTYGIARQLAPKGITVNAVCPGTTETPIIKGFTEDAVASLKTRIPIGRLGKPEDVATAVCYLASEEAGFVTGLLLDVNGGMYMG